MWEKKNKGTIKCDKIIVRCNVDITQCKDGTIKCEKKKIRELPNVTKVQSHMMLVLHNVRIVQSNVKKKKLGNRWMWQKYSHMWYLYYTMWGWDHQMWEKNKGITKCDKRKVTCDIGTT